jgi:AcrR family transcriptional regulator
MGRNNREEAAKTKKEIIEATKNLLLEVASPSKVTLREIAHAAGFTRGAVYVHFIDKDDLLVTVMKDMGDVLCRFSPVIRRESEGILDWIRRICVEKTVAVLNDTDEEKANLLFNKVNNWENDRMLDVVRGFDERRVDYLSALLMQAQSAGEMRNDISPGEAAAIINDVYCGIIGGWYVFEGHIPLEERAARTFDVVFSGLKA